MKKHSIFIITLLLLAGLAGCAGQEPDKTETEYPSAVSSTAETASASKVIDRSPAGTVSSSAETKLPEPAPTEQQKEKTEEPVLPESIKPGEAYRTCAGKLRPVEVYFGANAEACKTAESRIFFAPSGRRTAAERATAGKYTA